MTIDRPLLITVYGLLDVSREYLKRKTEPTEAFYRTMEVTIEELSAMLEESYNEEKSKK